MVNILFSPQSQTVKRLAAAHRGAVRALQAFIHNLPQEDINHGLPPLYGELALLIRQLSLCCTRLEIGGESDLLGNEVRDFCE